MISEQNKFKKALAEIYDLPANEIFLNNQIRLLYTGEIATQSETRKHKQFYLPE